MILCLSKLGRLSVVVMFAHEILVYRGADSGSEVLTWKCEPDVEGQTESAMHNAHVLVDVWLSIQVLILSTAEILLGPHDQRYPG